MEGWNIPILVSVLSGFVGNSITSWDDIVKGLDMNQRTSYGVKAFDFVTQCYKEGTGSVMPAKLLFGRWQNTDAQFSLLRCALQKDDRIDWTETGTGPNRQNVAEGSPSALSGNVHAWYGLTCLSPRHACTASRPTGTESGLSANFKNPNHTKAVAALAFTSFERRLSYALAYKGVDQSTPAVRTR